MPGLGRPVVGSLTILAYVLGWGMASQPAAASLLLVGPNALLKLPSAAAASAKDGDTISIAPGEYFDCAIWTADNLTIEGAVAGATLTDKACEGKAAFIIRGRGTVIRNLTFTRIRVADSNGAAIRVEAGDLTVEGSSFINNQIGLLAGDVAGSLKIEHCHFDLNGRSDVADKTADILVGRLDLLRVVGSDFRRGRGGAAITSHALRTELDGNSFDASAAPRLDLIGIPDGGTLEMLDNIVQLDNADRQSAIPIVAAARDAGLPGGVTIRRTIVLHLGGPPALLLPNWAGAAPSLEGNLLPAGDTELSQNGAIIHSLKLEAHKFVECLRSIYQQARHVIATVAHRFSIA